MATVGKCTKCSHLLVEVKVETATAPNLVDSTMASGCSKEEVEGSHEDGIHSFAKAVGGKIATPVIWSLGRRLFSSSEQICFAYGCHRCDDCLLTGSLGMLLLL
jgi:hypothetical protein